MCRIVRRNKQIVCTECHTVLTRKYATVEEELETLLDLYGPVELEKTIGEMEGK
jgi:hypothetical protein